MRFRIAFVGIAWAWLSISISSAKPVQNSDVSFDSDNPLNDLNFDLDSNPAIMSNTQLAADVIRKSMPCEN